MTDRHAGYVVTLDDRIREDDAQAILAAIRMIKGVLSVDPVVGDNIAEFTASQRERERLRAKLWALIKEID